MVLTNQKDAFFLNKIIHEGEYNPFSMKFKTKLNDELLTRATEEGVHKDVLNILRLGKYFNENYHKKLLQELSELIKEINLPCDLLRKLFIASLNENELINRSRYETMLNEKGIMSAFDRQNAVFVNEKYPNNPQNITSFSETIVEYGNIFLRYLAVVDPKPDPSKEKLSEEIIAALVFELLHVSNRYYGIKNHYDGCLFHCGNIELLGDDAIHFDLNKNDLLVTEQACSTMIENQVLKNINRLAYLLEKHSFQIPLQTKVTNRKLDEVIVTGGVIKYTLKKRSPKDFIYGWEHEISLEDYYAFYFKEPLKDLGYMTISDLFNLDMELSGIAFILHKKSAQKLDFDNKEQFLNHYLPKIKGSVLKGYLRNVTTFNDSEIDEYLKIATIEHNGQLNFYATPLVKEGDYYYFPYFTSVYRNTFFLTDYWLECANIDFDIRGKALERHIKAKLNKVKSNSFNKFHIVNKSNFEIDANRKEEIDIVIQTKNSIIIGEIKCVKYPMYERDTYHVLDEVIRKAVQQVIKKTDFLVENQSHFNEYSIENKTIIKVIILNYPVYSGVEIENCIVTDIVTFLSYFQADRMNVWESGAQSHNIIREILYYQNEDEFCNNFKNYLSKNPLIEEFKNKLQTAESSYKVDGLPKIIFTDVIPKKQQCT